jgi:predicted AlkP superfamily phosphohydrolase/phosphomutase
MVKHCEEDTYFLMVSDHGFGPISQTFYTNKWLEENGFLVRKKTHAYIDLKTKFLSKAAEIIRKVDSMFGATFIKAGKKILNPVSRRYFDGFELEKSTAIAARVSTTVEGIYILDESIKNELIAKLKDARDTDGNLLNINVTEKEQVCKGKYAEQAPDLFITVDDLNCIIFAHCNHHGSYFKKSVDTNRTGSHRMNGMYIFTGPDIHATELGLSLLDIAPTVLYALNKSIPLDMDGKAATELFTKKILPKFTKQAKGQDEHIETDDQIEIETLLKNLGYL